MKNLFHLLSAIQGSPKENRIIFKETGEVKEAQVPIAEGQGTPETPEQEAKRLFDEAEAKGAEAITKKASLLERMWTNGSDRRKSLMAAYDKASPEDKEALRLYTMKQVIKDAISAKGDYSRFAKDYNLTGTDIYFSKNINLQDEIKNFSWGALVGMMKDFPHAEFLGRFDAAFIRGGKELVASKQVKEELDTQFANAGEKEKFNLALKAGSEILGIKLASYDALKVRNEDDVGWLRDAYAKATPQEQEMLNYLYIGKAINDVQAAKPVTRPQTSYEKRLGVMPDPKMIGLSQMGDRYGLRDAEKFSAGTGGVSAERSYAYNCAGKLIANMDYNMFDRLYKAYTA